MEVLCVVRAHLVGKRGCMRRIGISFGRGGGRGGTGERKKEEEINEIFRKFLNVKLIHVKTMRRGE